MNLTLIFLVAVQLTAPPVAGPESVRSETIIPNLPVEAALADVFRSYMSLMFVFCKDESKTEPVRRAITRFDSASPAIISSIGKERAGRIVGELLVKPANLYGYGCPSDIELQRRLSTFDREMTRLDKVMGSQ